MTKKTLLDGPTVPAATQQEVETQEVETLARFRTPYTPQLRIVQEFKQPSRTKQEFKDECDVNIIVANFLRTGRLEDIQKAKGQFLDITALPVSYHEALNLVISAQAAFDALPASARARHDNDVNNFLKAAYEDPEGVFRDPLKRVQPSDDKPATTLAEPPPKAPEQPPAASTIATA